MKKVLIMNKGFPPMLGGIEVFVQWLATSFNLKVLFFSNQVNLYQDDLNLYPVCPLISFKKRGFAFAYFVKLFKIKPQTIIINWPDPVSLVAVKIFKIFYPGTRVLLYVHAPLNRLKIFNLLLYFAREYEWVFTSESLSLLFKGYRYKSHKIISLPFIPSPYSDVDDAEIPMDVLDGQVKYFFMFGRYSPYKGFDVVKSMLENNPMPSKVKIVLAGDKYLGAFFEGVEGAIVIPRAISEKEKSVLFSNCIGFLFPSTDTGEAFGLTQLEAMSHSKCIINTDLKTGVNEVGEQGRNAITVAPNCPEELYEAICTLSGDPDLCLRLGAEGKQRLGEEYSEDVIRGLWCDILN